VPYQKQNSNEGNYGPKLAPNVNPNQIKQNKQQYTNLTNTIPNSLHDNKHSYHNPHHAHMLQQHHAQSYVHIVPQHTISATVSVTNSLGEANKDKEQLPPAQPIAQVVQEVKAEVLNENSVHHFEGKNIVLFGNGAKKTTSFVSDRNDVKIVEDYKLTVKGMIPLALAAFEKVKFEDIAYFEPYYLKEFVSNTTKA
jgi:hypothetical protein